MWVFAVKSTYSGIRVASGCLVQDFHQKVEFGALQECQMFIRHSILVLVNEALGFVLNIQCIMGNCKGIVGETRLLEVVFEVGAVEVGIQFLYKALI